MFMVPLSFRMFFRIWSVTVASTAHACIMRVLARAKHSRHRTIAVRPRNFRQRRGATLSILEFRVGIDLERCMRAARIPLAIVLALSGNSVGATSPVTADPAPSGSPVFTLSGEVLANGGVTRARSPCFDLAASIGQPVSGSTQGGTYLLYAGFLGDFAPHDSIFRSSFEVCQP